ncbi:hypothetical protein BC939DRAFT_312506 [Gamsiella multidivaricata]|uniref:uncharacterized protein n=1 Tax=Gamsiella multidivaricata TaxID=101098 RepID=UPI002220BED7|nr:uncharacterized protein BC939DRAFT_312506 [Gamsiella multidivaricata]KAI7817836.1 hypothetical protein BC939DRAFT_312506 [Gamsiella multidivaricata]
MDNTSSNRGSTTFPQSVSDESAPDTSFPSTSVAAAAPESSTLAVKLSEDPEGQVRSGDNGSSDDGHASYREDLRPALKEGERESRGQSPAIRRSRSGRLLRSTVQYDERSSRSSSPDNSAELQGSYGRRARSSLHNPSGQSEGQGHPGRSEQDLTAPRRDPPASTAEGKQRRPSEASDNDNDNDNANKDSDNHRVSQQGDSSHQDEQYEDENQDELASEDDQEDDGYGEEGDDVNNEGSGSIETSSSRNDDGSEPLVVSMYGSPSLVKVRSMFIDKLFK